AIITALVSYALFRHQLKMKIAEIEGQSQLKARELLFESYHRRIERISNDAEKIGKAIGDLLHQLREIEGSSGSHNSSVPLFLIVSTAIDVYREDFEELVVELERFGIAKSKTKQISFVRECLKTDLSTITPNEIGGLYLNFMKSVGIIFGLKDNLLI